MVVVKLAHATSGIRAGWRGQIYAVHLHTVSRFTLGRSSAGHRRQQHMCAVECEKIKKILKEKKTENWESVGNSRGGYAAVPKACVLQMVEFARVELPCVATYNVGVRCSRVVNSILMAVSS